MNLQTQIPHSDDQEAESLTASHSRSEKLNLHKGYSRVFRPGHLTIGFITPIEGYSAIPTLKGHRDAARAADEAGFAAIWVRDVPLFDPEFSDAGQVIDAFAYAAYLSAVTSNIAIGTAGIVLPLRHPLLTAKEATSIDRLSGGRFILGLSSGDRPVEYPIFNLKFEDRAERYRQGRKIIRIVTETDFPYFRSEHFGNMEGQADLMPKPVQRILPTIAIGRGGQDVAWIGKEMDGFIWHGFNPARVPKIVAAYRATFDADLFKPFGYGAFFDLSTDPDDPFTVHGATMRSGRKALIEILKRQQDQGVSHVALNLRISTRPAIDAVNELAEYILPHFPTPSD